MTLTLGYTDRYCNFGHETSWLAILAAEPAAVADALGLASFEPCAWAAGDAGATEGLAVFVTSVVDGFVLIVGDWVGAGSIDVVEARTCSLAARFGEAQLFTSSRVRDVYTCIRARAGTVVESWAIEGRVVMRDHGGVGARDEIAVLACASAWGVDPTKLASRREPPIAGLAAPDPRPVAGRIVARRALRQPPAGSRLEAELHATLHIAECPECKATSVALHGNGRDALPWEDFAVTFALDCAQADCQVQWSLQYPRGSSYGEPPEAGDPRFTSSEDPSLLFSAAAWQQLLDDDLAALAEMPDWGYSEDLLASDSQLRAREALGAAMELGKFRDYAPQPDAAQIVWLTMVAALGLAAVGDG